MKQILLISLIFSVFLAAVATIKIANILPAVKSPAAPPAIPTPKDQSISFTGVVRTGGLSSDEKQKLGLTYSNYQVTELNEAINIEDLEFDGVYLEEESDLIKLNGQCVRGRGLVSGQSAAFINADYTINGSYTYRRLPLQITALEAQPPTECLTYQTVPDKTNRSNVDDILNLSGTIQRTNRPAPDIGEDYEIVLERPLLNIETGAGVRDLTNIYVHYDNRLALEENVDRKVKITATIAWGYAESRYLEIYALKTE